MANGVRSNESLGRKMNRRKFVRSGSLALIFGHVAPSFTSARQRFPSALATPSEPAQPAFLENGQVRIGIDLDSGGGIFYFSQKYPERNLVNHYDTGRFIQQSYYGDRDGSRWRELPWRWNPVQGGGCHGEKSKVLDSVITPSGIYVKTEPRLWATGAEVPDATMEEWISLQGSAAHIHFKFTYAGTKRNKAATQELPAVFMDYELSNLVFYTGTKPWTRAVVTRKVPGWPNEQAKADENWVAFVDGNDWGLGVYFPGTIDITTYRYRPPKALTTGPNGCACSYFAPTRRLAIIPDWTHEYDIWLMIGTVFEIRDAFYALQSKEGFPAIVES
jgi:hypothetical protein